MTAHLWEKSYPPGIVGRAAAFAGAGREPARHGGGNWPDKTAIDFYDRRSAFAQLLDLAVARRQGPAGAAASAPASMSGCICPTRRITPSASSPC